MISFIVFNILMMCWVAVLIGILDGFDNLDDPTYLPVIIIWPLGLVLLFVCALSLIGKRYKNG